MRQFTRERQVLSTELAEAKEAHDVPQRRDDMKELRIETDLPLRSLLTAGEVASFLRVSKKTVYRWAKEGAITTTKINRTLLIVRWSIVTLLSNPLNERSKTESCPRLDATLILGLQCHCSEAAE
jgi:excisionase family DNA binding protein